jgi:cytochrome c oxidase assembly protein subunit 15
VLARLRTAPRLLTALCAAALVSNALIVVTGAAVRLTSSGLGCPTWPRCTDESYVTTPEYGIHGYVEFGNRLLGLVVVLVAAACLALALAQRPGRRSLRWLSAGLVAGIGAQVVLGGITVRMALNPWTVAPHFLLSMALLYVAYALWNRSREGDGPRTWVVSTPVRALVRTVTGVAATVLVLGTVVTGSGPHAGDAAAARTGFDPEAVSQVHADAVFLLVGMTFATWLALRAATAPAALRRAAGVLLAVELAQGVVGFVQYLTDLPPLVVGLHIAGACATWVAACGLLFALRVRGAAAAQEDAQAQEEAQAQEAAPTADATASANRSADPSAYSKNSDGSVSSTSSTIGSPAESGITSTRA